MKKLFVLSLVLFSFIASVNAQEAPKAEEFDLQKCIDAAGTNMPEVKDCHNQEFEKQDIKLNAVYKEIKTKLKAENDSLSKEVLKRLNAAQKSWVASMEADCSLQSSSEIGGSLESMMLMECRGSETKKRVEMLEAFKKDNT